MPAPESSDLAFSGIARQAELIAAGEISSRQLVELYLERIERFDGRLNAFRVVFAERALMEADQADARRRAAAGSATGSAERPLLGVPIAVKDNIDVAGEVTAIGTNAYDGPAAADAEIVRRLRAAGALVIGKTNVPELCAYPWTETPTWGATRNPWNLDHTPGGSSGGSGAAVAAGLVGAALGNDGGGSIRFPSAYCGLFGLKSQRGRVPLAPHNAFQGLTVNGILTRTVRDTALFYDATAEGPSDAGAPEVRRFSFAEALRRGEDGLGSLRIAVSTNLPPSPLTRLHPDNEAALRETAELLRTLGHTVEEHELPHGPMAPPPEFSVRFMAGVHDEAMALPHPERLERRIRISSRLGGFLGTWAGRWAHAREVPYAKRMNRLFEDHDLLLTPVTPQPPPRVGRVDGRGWLWTLALAAATVPYVAPWNMTGQPAAALPAGLGSAGLPRAVQLVSRPGEEDLIVALAAQLEAARPWSHSRPPSFQ